MPGHASDLLVAEILFGDYGLSADVNPLRIPPGALTEADGVTLEGGALEKEPGATRFDTVSLAPLASGTLSAANLTWAAALVTFKKASGAAVVATTLGTFQNASGTTFPITVAGGASVGHRVVVVARDNAQASQSCTVTDSRGNTYTPHVTLTNLGGTMTLRVFSARVTTALLVGDTITVTYGLSIATGATAGTAVGFADDDNVVDRLSTATGQFPGGTDITVGPTAPLTYAPELLVYCAAWPSAATHTPGSNFTEQNEHDQVQVSYRLDATSPTIIALADYHPHQPTTYSSGFSVSAVKGSVTVTGTGTPSFDTRVFHNDLIELSTGGVTERRRVTAVTATTVTVADPWTTDFTALTTYTVVSRQRLLSATTAGSIFKERNGDLDAVALVSGISPAHPGVFVQAGKEGGAASNRKLFYLNGHDPVRAADGDGAMTALNAASEANEDWTGTHQPSFATVYRNRLVALGNQNHPHRVYLSRAANHRDFRTISGGDVRLQYDAHTNVGERLVTAAVVQDRLFLFKYPVGIIWLDATDASTANWTVKIHSTALGVAPSPYATLAIDDDVLFITPDARFHLLTAIDSPNGFRASDLSAALRLERWLRANINTARLNETVSAWHPQSRTAYFGLPGTGSPMNSVVVRFDFSTVGPPKFTYTHLYSPTAMATRTDPNTGEQRVMIGEGGTVFVIDPLNATGYTKNGQGYTSRAKTPYSDLRFVDPRYARYRKNFQGVELVFDRAAGTEQVTVEVQVDGTRVSESGLVARADRVVDRLPIQGEGVGVETILTTPATSTTTYRLLALRYLFELTGTEMR